MKWSVKFLKQTLSLISCRLNSEAGTPNIQGVLGLSAAIQFLSRYPHSMRAEHETLLFKQARQRLTAIPGCRLFGNEENSIANISFVIDGVDCQDIGTLLTEQGVAVRVGHHCTMPLMASLGVPATIRISLSGYNTKDEVMRFITLLEAGVRMLTTTVKDSNQEQQVVDMDRHRTLPIAKGIAKAKGWDQRYRQIMLAAKVLPELAPELRTSETEIFGCETQVWLSCRLSANPGAGHTDVGDREQVHVSIVAYASGKIIRGLLAVLLEPLQGQTIRAILAFDYSQHFKEIGLAGHLSESRGNGIKAVHGAIVRQLQDYINSD